MTKGAISLFNWHTGIRRTETCPDKYNLAAYRSFITAFCVQGIAFVIAIAGILWSADATTPSILAAIWIYLLACALSEFFSRDAKVRPFSSKKLPWNDLVAERERGRRNTTYLSSSSDYYYEVARNYKRLVRLLGEGADCEQFLFQFKHGLEVPWSSQLTNESLAFFRRMVSNLDSITSDNGFDAPEKLRSEIKEMTEYLEIGLREGADCVIVFDGQCSGMQIANGFW